jgi:hypothetical protein
MKARIMIGPHDVTEHVAAMYDAIIGSLDWGSSWLDVETQLSILLVGRLAGWAWEDPQVVRYRHEHNPHPIPPPPTYHDARLDAWRAQIQAMIDERARACVNQETCEDAAVELLQHVERIGK